MFQQAGRGYDMAITQFSPEGRLFQVEYAIEAVRRGTTAIVCRNSNSVVFTVEKKSSELQEVIGSEKIFKVDDHIGVAIAGALDFSFAANVFNVLAGSNITMGDDTWIGLGAAAGRIVFDSTPATDQIQIN